MELLIKYPQSIMVVVSNKGSKGDRLLRTTPMFENGCQDFCLLIKTKMDNKQAPDNPETPHDNAEIVTARCDYII